MQNILSASLSPFRHPNPAWGIWVGRGRAGGVALFARLLSVFSFPVTQGGRTQIQNVLGLTS